MISLITSKVTLAIWYANNPAIDQFINSIGIPYRIFMIPFKSIRKMINDIVAKMILNHCAKDHISPSSHERNWRYDKKTKGTKRNNTHKSLSLNLLIKWIEILV